MANNIGSVNFANNYAFPSVKADKSDAAESKHAAAPAAGDSVSIGGSDSVEKTKKKWTVLLYSAADNNLESALVRDVAELESVGSSNNMNLVVQLDRGEKPSSLSGGWEGCKRFYLTQDNDKSTINSPALADLGHVNMSDPKVLSEFIQWGIKEFPAENYMLVMSDHGAGWPGALEDESHGGFASTPDLKSAIADAEKKTGERIDRIGFDACLMASTEVAHELSSVGDFMVASQNVEGGDGWPYSKIFSSKTAEAMKNALDQRFDIAPEDVAMKMVNDSHGFPSISTLAAIDLAKVKDLTAATDKFAQVLMDSSVNKETIKNIAKKTKSWYGFKDQYDFADKLIKEPSIKDEKLKAAAKEMQAALKEAVIAEQHSSAENGAHGLSLEISPSGVKKEGYADLQFAKDTKWDEAMKWLDKP